MQLEAALSAAFVRLDREIRAAVPDGTTAGVVLFKRAQNGACTEGSRRGPNSWSQTVSITRSPADC